MELREQLPTLTEIRNLEYVGFTSEQIANLFRVKALYQRGVYYEATPEQKNIFYAVANTFFHARYVSSSWCDTRRRPTLQTGEKSEGQRSAYRRSRRAGESKGDRALFPVHLSTGKRVRNFFSLGWEAAGLLQSRPVGSNERVRERRTLNEHSSPLPMPVFP
jgi:hypothetical protein